MALLYPMAGNTIFFRSLNNRMADAMFRLRGPRPTSGQVVIVDIDEASLGELGQWPWPRTVMARLLARIVGAGARVVGFDMVFAEADRTSPARILAESGLLPTLDEAGRSRIEALDHDRVFGDAIADGPVVLGYIFQTGAEGKGGEERPFPAVTLAVDPASVPLDRLLLPRASGVILNLPTLATAPTEGFLNVFPDPSGTVRRAPLFLHYQGIPYPSMPMEVFRMAIGTETVVFHAGAARRSGHPVLALSVGERLVATDAQGRLVLNFRGPGFTFPYLPAAEVLAGKHDNELAGKLVLIGTSAAGLRDFRATPFTAVCPGVEINATIIDNLLAGDAMRYDRYTEQGMAWCAIIGGGLALTLLLAATGPLAGGLASLCSLAGLVAGDYLFLFGRGVVAGVSFPLAALVLVVLLVTLANYLTAGRQKRFVETAFSRYVSSAVLDQLTADPGSLRLAGAERRVTVLFSDIRGFTTLSETMAPEELGRFMNRYLTEMSDIVMAHDGTVDKFIGDAIMALWGAPLADEAQAEKAVRAALAMEDRLAALRPAWEAEGLPRVAIGVGINTGMVTAGNFGSESRFDYTVLGDEVNLASRLEGANKTYGTTVIISEATRAACPPDLVCRYLDLVRVKGKHRPVRIFEPLCFGEPPASLAAELARYQEALAAWETRDFASAGRIFTELAAAHPLALYRLYAERCRHYAATPPPADWDGVYVFTSK